jgi:hypothetical protein
LSNHVGLRAVHEALAVLVWVFGITLSVTYEALAQLLSCCLAKDTEAIVAVDGGIKSQACSSFDEQRSQVDVWQC